MKRSFLQYGFIALLLPAIGLSQSDAPACSAPPATLALSDPPYENYFYSDCNVAAQVVVTSPLPDSNLSLISPRLIVATPAGNSGICAYFAPQNGVNGSLAISLVNSSVGNPLAPVYAPPVSDSRSPSVGITGLLHFNSSAFLTVPIMGSIRTIRDFVEGPSLLQPGIQGAIEFASGGGSVSLRRTWLDNVTLSSLEFTPSDSCTDCRVTVDDRDRTVAFEAGDYVFSATLDYPQLTQLSPSQVLNSESSDLITQFPDQAIALSFLSYTEKLLAGAWRFLTYFGRDSMIAALLLEPVLSYGNASAMEAVIGAVLERINRTDGSVCHEETLGDYATFLNLQQNISSSDMICDYKMVDSDFFLAALMDKYFLQNSIGQDRWTEFSSKRAGSINAANENLTYGELAVINAQRVMDLAAPFARKQTKENLIRLKEGQIVGQWRDSTYGIGGGQIAYDVNTALVPAALRSIATLARARILPRRNWAELADKYAKTWEDNTLHFFEVNVPQGKAKELVMEYAQTSNFSGPDQSDSIDGDVNFYALALDGYNDLSKIEVMNTDDCFRLFLLNTTDQKQLTSFVNQTANNVRRQFPAGLMTGVSLVVANPAYGENPVYAQNFTTGAYHGTVVWSWQLAMMVKGLELQLGRCSDTNSSPFSSANSQNKDAFVPDFCQDTATYENVKTAYNILWDSIEANSALLSSEVWSWVYQDGRFVPTPLGVLPPPPGVGGQTESNIRQLWSLTFMAVTRNAALR